MTLLDFERRQELASAAYLDLSIVILTGGADRILLERCLRATINACRFATNRWEIILLDNASEWHVDEWASELFPEVTVLRFPTRVGFCTGNNAGFVGSAGRYILQLNDDAEPDLESLRQLIRFMDDHEGAPAAGPRLVNPDGSLQVGYYARRLPTVIDIATHLLGVNRFWPSNAAFRKHLLLDEPDETREVEQPAGAALFYRRSVLFGLGLHDDDYTYALDDVDICRRMRDQGLRLYYVKEARVFHHGAVTFASITSGLSEYTINGICCYFAKHESWPKFFLVRLLILFSLALRTMALSAAKLLGRRLPGRVSVYVREFWRVAKSLIAGYQPARLATCEPVFSSHGSHPLRVRHG